MDIGGAAGMVDAAGTEKPVSVGVGVGEGGVGVGKGEGGFAGAFLAESVAAGGGDSGSTGGAGRSIGGEAGTSSSGTGGIKGDEAVKGIGEWGTEDGENAGGKAEQDRGERRARSPPPAPDTTLSCCAAS
jgi:hypothetical protein